METYLIEDIVGILLMLYLLAIIILTAYLFPRYNKFRRWTGNNIPKGNFILISGIGYIFVFFLLPMSFFKVLFMLSTIFMFAAFFYLLRRKCPFCRETVKDRALICSHCGSNISDSTIE
jgi:hypothetical protein